jgi:hypothetical protein
MIRRPRDSGKMILTAEVDGEHILQEHPEAAVMIGLPAWLRSTKVCSR